MIVSMQGNWRITVKARNAAFPQKFIVQGAIFGNGTHSATVVGSSVFVIGTQWSVAIMHDPGTGYQISETKLKFPRKVGDRYEFDIESNDTGNDQDFDDLILTCSRVASINTFMVYGNVSTYSGRCIFNPCRRWPFVIDTYAGFAAALKNPDLKELIQKFYPERIPIKPVDPNPPDPIKFKPIVLDLSQQAMRPKTALLYKKIESEKGKLITKARIEKEEEDDSFSFKHYTLDKSVSLGSHVAARELSAVDLRATKSITELFFQCRSRAAAHTTLSFTEYDRTDAEKAGGAYTGTGNRQVLGDTITDMFGNYIFAYNFDMTFPGIADSADIAAGEEIDVVAYPDLIVSLTGVASWDVIYESAPYYNVPNLKRIDLCLPDHLVHRNSGCANGNVIGSLGNVFIGGNQNVTASLAPATLRRYGNNNFLEADGKISVHSSLAGFTVDCAPWGGVVDVFGCLYDETKTLAQNPIRWYTIRIRRQGTSRWEFVSQNYKHPQFPKRNLPNYTGDDVGSFTRSLRVDGGAPQDVPAYMSIRADLHENGVLWEDSKIDRLIQLNTGLYDVLGGEHTPGTFHLRIDGYDAAGNPVANGTDLIAMYIHNRPLNFEFQGATITDASVVNAGCGLFRLTDAQLNTPVSMGFMANDPYGFVESYSLSMSRCPAPMLALQVNAPGTIGDTASGVNVLASGSSAANSQAAGCPGYTGTILDFANAGVIGVNIQPAVAEGGWIKAGEYYTVYGFSLTAYKKVTNGYNGGVSGPYYKHTQIAMERIS